MSIFRGDYLNNQKVPKKPKSLNNAVECKVSSDEDNGSETEQL